MAETRAKEEAKVYESAVEVGKDGFQWDPRFLRCVVGGGRLGHMDAAMLSVVRAQLPETGADLLPEGIVPRVREMLVDAAAGLCTARDVCRVVLGAIVGQVRDDGSVVAAPLTLAQWEAGHRPAPFHRFGWVKQGHMAAAALIAAYSGSPVGAYIARLIAVRLWQWMTLPDSGGLWVVGLWSSGDPKQAWGRASAGWAWVDRVVPFEDATQCWNAVALRVLLPHTSWSEWALDGMAHVAEVNSGLIPYCASPRSGMPEFGRFGVLYSTEQSARVAVALRDMGATRRHLDAAGLIERRLAELEKGKGSGKWPAFVDGDGRTVYPLAEAGNPKVHAVPAAVTRDANRAVVTPDFSGLTDKPAMAMG